MGRGNKCNQGARCGKNRGVGTGKGATGVKRGCGRWGKGGGGTGQVGWGKGAMWGRHNPGNGVMGVCGGAGKG